MRGQRHSQGQGEQAAVQANLPLLLNLIGSYCSYIDKERSIIERQRSRVSSGKSRLAPEESASDSEFANKSLALLKMREKLVEARNFLEGKPSAMEKELGNRKFSSLPPASQLEVLVGASIGANRIYEAAHIFNWREEILSAVPRTIGECTPEKVRELKAYLSAALSEQEELLAGLKAQKAAILEFEKLKPELAKRGQASNAPPSTTDAAPSIRSQFSVKQLDRFIADRQKAVDRLVEAQGFLDDPHKLTVNAGLSIKTALDFDSNATSYYLKSGAPSQIGMIALDVAALLGSFVLPVAGAAYFSCRGLQIVGYDYAKHGRLTPESTGGIAMALLPAKYLGIFGKAAGTAGAAISAGAGAYVMASSATATIDIITDAGKAGWAQADVEGVLSNGLFIGVGFLGAWQPAKGMRRGFVRGEAKPVSNLGEQGFLALRLSTNDGLAVGLSRLAAAELRQGYEKLGLAVENAKAANFDKPSVSAIEAEAWNLNAIIGQAKARAEASQPTGILRIIGSTDRELAYHFSTSLTHYFANPLSYLTNLAVLREAKPFSAKEVGRVNSIMAETGHWIRALENVQEYSTKTVHGSRAMDLGPEPAELR